MKFLKSSKCWLAVFVIMTTVSAIGSLQQTTWVDNALQNEIYSFKVLTGFYWKSTSTNENTTTIIEKSYLLFPGFKPISVEKTTYNGSESITVDESVLESYVVALLYILSIVISARYLKSLLNKKPYSKE